MPAGAYSARVLEYIPDPVKKMGVLEKQMLKAWFSEVRKIKNPIISAYLQTVLLTGARREEIGTLTWENVDFQWQNLTIADKVNHERQIPLTPYVASLLSNLPRRNKWVFSSTGSKSGRLVEPRKQHNTAVEAAGIPHLTIHDLRRSFSTLSEWCEVPAGITAQIMGHHPSALVEQHYKRRPLDLLRMWHAKFEKWILDQAGIAQPAEVAEGLKLVKK